MTALFAAVYPCAGGTTFSSIMMNSNLAAVLWSGALYVGCLSSTLRSKVFIALLLVLSALSYEAFVPLFLALLLTAYPEDGAKTERERLLDRAIPLVSALSAIALYRGWIEKLIFHSTYSRLSVPGPLQLALKLLVISAEGAKVALLDSWAITARALRRLDLLTPGKGVAVVLVIALAAWFLYTSSRVPSSRDETRCVARWVERLTGRSIVAMPSLDLLALSLLLFALAHTIFVFADYLPTSVGFENRTLGGVRFASAFLFAVAVRAAWQILEGAKRDLAVRATSALVVCFALSVAVQREAWSAAAHYNDLLLDHLVDGIRRERLDETSALTLIAAFPASFPDAINGEPILAAPWDLSPALSLRLPQITFHADVHKPRSSVADGNKVTVDGWWQANYPFYFYRFPEHRLHLVSSSEDFLRLAAR